MKALDLKGQKFGKLKVISRAENSISGKARWNCLCDCGNSTVSISGNLKQGLAQSCGCIQINKVTELGKNRLDDLKGKKFGRLTVLNRDETKTGEKPRWICQCDCNILVNVSSANLKNGSTNSCGCLRLEISAKVFYKHGQSGTIEYARQKSRKQYFNNKNNVFYMTKRRISGLIRATLKLQNVKKESKTIDILGCSYEYFKTHIEKQFTEGMNWDKFSEIHIDHIIPMASAKTVDEIYSLNHFTNLRPMWALDNIKKGSKIMFLL